MGWSSETVSCTVCGLTAPFPDTLSLAAGWRAEGSGHLCPKHAGQRAIQPLDIKIGDTFQHYKGDIYTVVLLTVDEASGEVLIHYESDKGRGRGWLPWTRTLKNFLEPVPEKDLQRHNIAFTPGVAVQRFIMCAVP